MFFNSRYEQASRLLYVFQQAVRIGASITVVNYRIGFGEPGAVRPMALTLSGTALAAGGWSCVSKQRTGG